MKLENVENSALYLLNKDPELDKRPIRIAKYDYFSTETDPQSFLLSTLQKIHQERDKFKGNIKYLSASFYESQGSDSLNKFFEENPYTLKNEHFQGVILTQNQSGAQSTIFYKIIFNEEGVSNNALLVFLLNQTVVSLITVNKGVVKSFMMRNVIKNITVDENSYKDALQGILQTVTIVKYCPIEIKESARINDRLRPMSFYQNKKSTDFNIAIVDTTWFTTLVRTEGFGVRGHWRFQSCGKEMKERKLIWISDFKKEGYVRNFKRPLTLVD